MPILSASRDGLSQNTLGEYEMPKIVRNKLLGGWYIVCGKHQTPINGRFESRQAASDYLVNHLGREFFSGLRTANNQKEAV